MGDYPFREQLSVIKWANAFIGGKGNAIFSKATTAPFPSNRRSRWSGAHGVLECFMGMSADTWVTKALGSIPSLVGPSPRGLWEGPGSLGRVTFRFSVKLPRWPLLACPASPRSPCHHPPAGYHRNKSPATLGGRCECPATWD